MQSAVFPPAQWWKLTRVRSWRICSRSPRMASLSCWIFFKWTKMRIEWICIFPTWIEVSLTWSNWRYWWRKEWNACRRRLCFFVLRLDIFVRFVNEFEWKVRQYHVWVSRWNFCRELIMTNDLSYDIFLLNCLIVIFESFALILCIIQISCQCFIFSSPFLELFIKMTMEYDRLFYSNFSSSIFIFSCNGFDIVL